LFAISTLMKKKFTEQELAPLAKQFREAAGKSKVKVARELGVAPPTVFGAEEKPEQSLTALRIRMIEKYSPYKVTGPFYVLEKQ
jgi:hypothetical protein